MNLHRNGTPAMNRLATPARMLLLSILAVACATNAPPGDAPLQPSVAIASDATLQLLPAGSVLRNLTLTQRIDASYSHPDDKQSMPRSFIVQIESAADEMRMVGLTPMGVQIFALTQRGAALDIEVPAFVSLPFDPRYMLADMQLALAPMAELNARLAGAQLQQAHDGGRVLVASDGTPRMRIDYDGTECASGGELHLQHLQRGYRIHITTIACDSL